MIKIFSLQTVNIVNCVELSFVIKWHLKKKKICHRISFNIEYKLLIQGFQRSSFFLLHIE